MAVSAQSLNTNNAFVLDAGSYLYLWLGAKSSRVTRAKALDLAQRVRREERSSRAEIINIGTVRWVLLKCLRMVRGGKDRQQWSFLDCYWWKTFVCWRCKICPSCTTCFWARQRCRPNHGLLVCIGRINLLYLHKIFRVGCDPNSKAAQIQVVDECINRLPKKELLNTTGVFVVDTGSEVFCWIGKASGARPRKHGLRIALVFLPNIPKI